MVRNRNYWSLLVLMILSLMVLAVSARVGIAAESTNTSGPQAVVPRLMKFSGVLHDASGKPLTGTVDVTFALYNTEAGGSPLWFETQSVQADELGRYTALLGAMHTDGLPIDLFTSGEVRWLGIQVGLEAEQLPRVLLVSVPYALKAEDSEKLGGKRASDFVLAEQLNEKVRATETALLQAESTMAQTGKVLSATPAAAGGGAPKTTPATSFADSNTTQVVSVQQNDGGDALTALTVSTTNGKAGVRGQVTGASGLTFGVQGTNTSNAGTGVSGIASSTTGSTIGVTGQVSSPSGIAGLFWNTSASTTTTTRILSGRSGASPGTEKFSVDNAGKVRAYAYLDLNGHPTGTGGTVTSVLTGPGLTGGPITNTGTLSLDTAFTDLRYSPLIHTHAVGDILGAATLTSNTFQGNQSITGDLSLTGTINSNGLRVLPTSSIVNVIGGDSRNWVGPGVVGATIGGGGPRVDTVGGNLVPNRVTHNAGTVGGGSNNQAGDDTGMPLGTECCATVGGGMANKAAGDASFIGGGFGNVTIMGGWAAAIGGGQSNEASGTHSAIGGGLSNKAVTWADTVAGGASNTAKGGISFVGSGSGNTASGYGSTVGGGEMNTGSGWMDTIPGGRLNTASGGMSFAAGSNAKAVDWGSFVWGDATGVDVTSMGPNSFVVRATGGAFFSHNLTAGHFFGDGSGLTGINATTATNADTVDDLHAGAFALAGHTHAVGDILGAASTQASNTFLGNQSITGNLTLEGSLNNGLRILPSPGTPSVIGGFAANTVTSGVNGATISGGGWSGAPNRVTDDWGFVGGGADNQAGNNDGDVHNASATTVSGGGSNTASGDSSTVGGGNFNISSGNESTVGGGDQNTASGWGATVPGGWLNLAAGMTSFAAGHHAKALHDGAFVWADSGETDLASTGGNQFLARATGGFTFITNTDGSGIPTASVTFAPSSGSITTPGSVSASNFIGDGSGLTNLNLSGVNHAATADLATNALALGGFSAESFARQNTGNTFSGDQTVTGSLTLSGPINGGLRVQFGSYSPNVIGGWLNNSVGTDVQGASIGGGGQPPNGQNRVTDDFGTVGGGSGNMAGNDLGPKDDAYNATVSGGGANSATARHATVGGGMENTASGAQSTVGGGAGNIASGFSSTVPGGSSNTAQGDRSFAAGSRAKALNRGAFVWADLSEDADFASVNDNEFRVRAASGAFFSADLHAGHFFGDGSGLTNLPGGPANSLTCDRCVGNQELGISYAGSSTQGGPAISALTADTAAAATTAGWATEAGSTQVLGGIDATFFARRDAANTFSNNQNFTDNVGIGTASPGDKLHVSGGGVRVNPDGTDYTPFVTGISVNMDEHNGRAGLALHSAGAGLAYLGYSSPDLDGKDMLILGTDNRGNDMGFFTNLDSVPNTDNLNISGKEPVMLIKGTGNVGIGTTAPSEKLDVSGNINASGNVSAASFTGDGSGLTNLNIANVPGAVTPEQLTNGLTAEADARIAAGATLQADINNRATVGANTFSGDQTVTSGDLSLASGKISLPESASATAGVIYLGGSRFMHSFPPSHENTFVGGDAGNFTTSGGDNTASGFQALSSNTTGFYNTASGVRALQANTTGYYNVASGASALFSNTEGHNNVASGVASLYYNTTGELNTASGNQSLTSNTTGGNNTAFGARSLFFNTTGEHNTAVGLESGGVNSTGSYNTSIGYGAGPNWIYGDLSYTTAIGAGAVVSQSNSLVLGGTGAAAVNVGIGTATPAHTLDVVGTGNFSGAVNAASFTGDGAGLTNLNVGNITGPLQANLDAEVTARTNADTLLQNNLNEEGAARQAADGNLQSAIDTEATTRAAADANEAGLRTAADGALQSDLGNRVSKSGDTMTGPLNLPANGLTVGTSQLVLSGDNIGIGTASPAYNLHVRSTTPLAKFWFEGFGSNASPELHLKSYSGPAYLAVDRADQGSAAAIRLLSGGHEKWNFWMPDDLSGDFDRLDIRSASGIVMTFKQPGNVGIGTTTPGQKLSVNGTVESTSGGFKFPDGSTQTTASTGSSTATDLNCVGCVSSSELDFNYAGSSSKGGVATSALAADTAVTATDALSLGGVAASGYVLKGGDTMAGTLNLPANGLIAGTNQLVLTGGNVGFGTATPAHNFHAMTSSPMGQFWFEGTGINANPELRLKSRFGNAYMYVDRADVGGNAVLGLAEGGVDKWDFIMPDDTSGEAYRLDLNSAGAGRVMSLKQSGNVGIGTINPGQKLTVAGTVESTAGGFKFPDGSTQTTASSAGGTATNLNCTGCVSLAELDFTPLTQAAIDAEAAARSLADSAAQTVIDSKVSKAGDTMTGILTLPVNGLVAGTNQLILTAGNVGIGTASPAQKLSVVGTVESTTGGFKFPDGSTQTSAASQTGELVLVLMDDFNAPTLGPTMWNQYTTGAGTITLGASAVTIETHGPNTAILTGKKQFSVLGGTLIFKGNLMGYQDGSGVYGDRQPRGLAAGSDRNNAIEFISASRTSVTARTVSGGVATETTFDLSAQMVSDWAFCQIVATPSIVKFYYDGSLVATHTTNIPTAPLNVYLGTTYNSSGTIYLQADYVSFERRM